MRFHNIYPDEPFPDEFDYYSDGTGDPDILSVTLEVGMTQAQITAAAPSISGIDPDHGVVGQSGTITVNGTNLIDPITGDASPAIDGAGVTVSVNGNPSESQVDLNFTVAQNAPTGNKTLTLSNRFGTDGATFAVGYPAAHVTSLSPPSWQAGQSFTLTINGTGFGTAPTVAISGAAGVQYGQAMNTNPQGTQTQVPVTVQANAPDATATVTVTPGYVGSSYICGNCNGGSPDGTDTAPVQQNLLPPTIAILNGGTATPYAGQPVTVRVDPPNNGFTINSQTWGFGNSSDAVANYIASATSGCYVPVETGLGSNSGACSGVSFNNIQTTLGPFFFIVPGQQESIYVDAYYAMADGSFTLAPRATMTFTNIQGPTGNLLPNAYLQTDNSATAILNAQASPATLKMKNAPADPNVSSNPNVGVRFDDLAQLPRGALIWVQIINSVIFNQISSPQHPYNPDNFPTGLDGVYPYVSASDNTTNDSPGRSDLMAGLGEAAESFDATMHVLWDPAIPAFGQASCKPATTSSTYVSSPSTCASIPIPLGSIRWKWSPCAINAIPPPPSGSGPSWFLRCGPGFKYPATASGYPTWTHCDNSANGNC